ncbi:hypothetical protein Csa_017808 [Cucumis sativus]|nr:hypothetical protein Csa_017808 [Cucumis sativus]
MEAAAMVVQNEKGFFFFVDCEDVEETENSKLEEAFEAVMATGEYNERIDCEAVDMELRDDLERLKRIRNQRGLRHYWVFVSVVSTLRLPVAEGRLLGVSKKR